MKVTPGTLRANQEIPDMLLPFDFAVADQKNMAGLARSNGRDFAVEQRNSRMN